jgi:MerR family transcriptional regulator, thiopeptide resistance regulator
MPWSTRQLADLAGTTVKAVRYYHDAGLLDEPERAANGYKRYGVEHLLRVLQIRRLVELGMPLERVATMERADRHPVAAIRELDDEIAATIERLEGVRSELALILRHRSPIDLPEGFAAAGERVSEADRSLLMVMSRVLDADALAELRSVMDRRDPSDDEFDALADDASDAEIEALATRMAERVAADAREMTALGDLGAHLSGRRDLAIGAVGEAIAHAYRPAQLRVLIRIGELTG